MNEFQYCYWLMGVFELGQPQTLSTKQVYLIKEHLDLVTERKYTFCNWLDGFLDAHGTIQLDNQKLAKVLNKLRLEFLNVIDKSYPKELWEPLQKAHDGEKYIIPKNKKEIKKKDDPPMFKAMC